MQVHHPQHNRLNDYHSPKQRMLGAKAAQAAPAWKGARNGHPEAESKILMSRLPADILENEVEALFTKTVGPVKDVFMIFNSQGRTKGMAVVTFQRSGDAVVARTKYNGKIVDGRRPIKIEIIIDEDIDPRTASTSKSPTTLSLLQRIAPIGAPTVTRPVKKLLPIDPYLAPPKPKEAPTAPLPLAGPLAPTKVRLRTKKGPRRVKKQGAEPAAPHKKTLEELDQEMDEYRARTGSG